MAQRASNSKPAQAESPQKTAARHRKLRNGVGGALTLRPGTVGGGRAIGQTNNLNRQAKTNLEEAFFELGGVPALVRWAKKNRGEFYTKLWARLIPKDVQLGPSEGLEEMLAILAEKHRQEDGDIIDAEVTEVSV